MQNVEISIHERGVCGVEQNRPTLGGAMYESLADGWPWARKELRDCKSLRAGGRSA